MTVDQLRKDLALAYQILAHLKMDDSTYTHLSARLPGHESFFIYPFGLLFQEVTPACLLKVDMEGNVLEGQEYQYNRTGYVIHSSIYKHRPDINAVFHLHTEAGVAVSAMSCGLMPISQHALHFYEKVSYHPYNSLVLDTSHTPLLVQDLGSNKTMFMENHGTLTCGSTLHEALFYTYHLERACKIQCMALNSQAPLILPDADVCRKSVKDLLGFEKDLGLRDWLAYKRILSCGSKIFLDAASESLYS